MKKRLAGLLAGIILISGSMYAQEQGTKKEITKKLIYSMGTKETAQAIINQLMEMYIGIFPDVPASTWESIRNEINVDELVELSVPIYEKYFTEDELKDIAAFYESPTGKKLAAVTPAMTEESMRVGQDWGLRVAGRIMDKISKTK